MNKLNSYNIVLEESGTEYQNRVHLSCFMDPDYFTTALYPSKDKERDNQTEPLFNHDGTIVSFLSQDDNTNGHYSIYTVNINEANDCGRFNDKYRKDPTMLNYTKIDSFIINDDYTLRLPHARIKHTSYCWHPSKNILFYIKRDQDTASFDNTYSIYYYVIGSDDGPIKLDIPLLDSKYITISNDGKYLLFSFKSIDSKYEDTFKFNNYDKKLHDSYDKIALVKLKYE